MLIRDHPRLRGNYPEIPGAYEAAQGSPPLARELPIIYGAVV